MQRFVTRMLITVSIILGISVMCPGIVAEAVEYTVSGDSSQKLYETSSENSKVVANVIPGNSFTILETVKDTHGKNWHHVSMPGGVTGYIIASRVVEVEQENAEPQMAAEETEGEAEAAEEVQETQEPENDEAPGEIPEEAENENNEDQDISNVSVRILSNTNLRDEPSLDGNILIVIPKDVTITPLEKIGTNSYYWYRLTYLTQTGYVRADTVEEYEVESKEETEGEEPEEEVPEESTQNASVSTPPKVVRRSASSTVSYEDSYDRRHKWDDPEVTSSDEKSHKRILDIYFFIFVILAAAFMVVGISVLGNALRSMKRLFQSKRKIRKQRGAKGE